MSLIRITPLSHGKHNNLHMSVKIGGSRKHPLYTLKLIVFFDTARAFIVRSNIKEELIDILNIRQLTNLIQSELDEMDFNLFVFDIPDFYTKPLTTEALLEKIKNYESHFEVSLS